MGTLYDQQNEALVEQAIESLLNEGVSPTAAQVEERYLELLAATTLGVPKLNASETSVSAYSNSSASKFNKTSETISKDLKDLYSAMHSVSDTALLSFDRWKLEMQRLEGQINLLNNRVDGLLLITQDTEGYFNFVSDNFADTSKIDVPNSSVVVDLRREVVTVGSTDSGATRVFVNTLKTEDVSFKVISQNKLTALLSAPGGELTNAFDDTTKFWQSRAYMSTPGTVLGELRVKLAEKPVKISRITFKLHSANTSSSVLVTPLYSVDNFEFKQLPGEAPSLSIISTGSFTFEEVEAKYMKFLLVKEGFDNIDGSSYVYEFGAEEISFFSEGYTENTSALLYSTPLSVKNSDGTVAEFNRAALSSCESIPENGAINFYVAAHTSSATAIADLNWIPIDPLNREPAVNPTSINFAELVSLERGNTATSGDWVKVSYNATNNPGVNPEFSNPAAEFTLMDVTSGTISVSSATGTGMRYLLPSNNDRILNHQIKTTVPLDLAATVVLRNLGVKGDKALVRGTQSGWGFSESYYSTVIEIKNKDGLSLNFGDKEFIHNSVATKGKVFFEQGFHSVKIHKDNWLDIANDITTLATLKSTDKLYPFNHKLLIEGYKYGGGFTEEKIYTGVDLFAEFRMKQVSPFDLLRSVRQDDYSKFGMDLDVKDGARDPSRVILLKSDASIPDFINERFVIRMKVDTGSLLFKYIWVKAEFKTSNPSVAPVLDGYRLRLGK